MGDRVKITVPDEGGFCAIEEILPRKNKLKRPALVNIDALVIVCSTVDPQPNYMVIDKMTAAAVNNHMEPVIVVSKNDIKNGDRVSRIYRNAGLEVFQCSPGNRAEADRLLRAGGLESAGDAFRLINETWTYVESVFPYKRVFTKYELALVSNCINLAVHGGYQKKNYMELLEPFNREVGENKAKQLLDTLETFVLDAGMNSGKTSAFMGIHTNTVQYRLKRINEVLGAEITGNRVIPGLTIALALKRLEGVVK